MICPLKPCRSSWNWRKKKEPGKLNFGSGGSGTSEHLAGEMFKHMAGLDIVHIPYKGGAAAMVDLVAGRISAIIINQITALPMIESGKVRALAVADDKRSPKLPEIPTFSEHGYPDYRVSVWWGVMVPSGVSDDLVTKLDASVREGIATPGAQESLQTLGVEVLAQGPQQFGDFLTDEIKRWSEIVTRSVEPI